MRVDYVTTVLQAPAPPRVEVVLLHGLHAEAQGDQLRLKSRMQKIAIAVFINAATRTTSARAVKPL